jgi:hypothetical protein
VTAFVTFDLLGQLGRLGNQLFQIAATIGAARRNHCACTFPEWPYEVYFNGLPRDPGRPRPRVPLVEQSYLYQPLEIRETCHLVGYFQSEKYFAHCAGEIRRALAPNPTLRAELEARFAAVLALNPCAIHVRRADYIGNPLYANLGDGGYYERAMRAFGRETLFLLFSDDIGWCRRRFQPYRHRIMFVEGLTELGDFFLMSACAHQIIANSSFSWWAAWLNANPSKRVVAPLDWFSGDFADESRPFVAGPPQSGYHDTRDLVPEAWIRL